MSATKGRDPLTHYETPAWAVDAILGHLDLGGPIWEPAAGNGGIVKRLLARGVSPEQIEAFELEPDRARELGALGVRWRAADALQAAPGERPRLIVGNPPYTHAERFVTMALEVAGEGGTVAFLLRLGFLESRARRALHIERPADLYVLPSRPSFTNDGRVDASAYAWFVWRPGGGGRWQILPARERPTREDR